MIKFFGIVGAAAALLLASPALAQNGPLAKPGTASPTNLAEPAASTPPTSSPVDGASPAPAKAPQAAPATAPNPAAQQSMDTYSKVLQMHLAKFNQYPEEAKKKNLEGTVIVHITLDRGGKLLSSEVAQGSGSKVLDDAAIKMVKAASPLPAMPQDFFPDAKVGEFMVPIVYMK